MGDVYFGGGYSNAQQAYLQDATPPRHQRQLGGNGGTLFVPGMADSAVKRNGCTSSFRSSPGAHGEAHMKELRHLSHDKLSPQLSSFTPRKSPSESRAGSAAFSAKVDDRYSYLPSASASELTSRLFGAYEPNAMSPPQQSARRGSTTARGGSPSASFRSTTPTASAHFRKNKLIEPHYLSDEPQTNTSSSPQPPGAGMSSVQRQSRLRPTSSFRSSADRDSYIKALPQRLDSYSPLVSDFDKCARGRGSPSSPRGGTAPFKSKTSIGDAHIRAMNKPVDVCLAYSSPQSPPHRNSPRPASAAMYLRE